MSSREYEEFVESLTRHGARFLLVGAHAVAFYAQPRATKDLDVLVDNDEENAARVLEAIRDFFGGADLGLRPEDLTERGRVVQLGVAPARIDILTSLPSIPEFGTAWSRRVSGRFGDVRADFLSLEDLLREKQASDRLQDQADAESLQRARRGDPEPER